MSDRADSVAAPAGERLGWWWRKPSTTTFPSPPMPELTGQTAGWLDLMRAGDTTARQRLIEHSCERLRGLARKMLRRYPKVHRWEETDDVFVEAVTRLHRALETVQPESPRHFYNLAATQIRRVLIDLSRRYYGAEGLGSHHDTAARNPDDDTPPKYEQADASGEPVEPHGMDGVPRAGRGAARGGAGKCSTCSGTSN